jgi:gliding motility-associated-like protein
VSNKYSKKIVGLCKVFSKIKKGRLSGYFTKRHFAANSMKLLVFLSFILLINKSEAQLCTGSLGDPVVKIDFGSGTSTHGSQLGKGITSYTWTTADFPQDGYYTVESRTNTANTWWTTTDHTGGGYMMVVNASFSLTDYFYKNKVGGLCPNTTYEFAAWIMNLLRYSDNSTPNITFTIETTKGTELNTYSTGDIPRAGSAKWKHYGFYFTTPDNVTDVVIRMRNNKVGAAPGNDIALDDITFRPCGPDVTAAILNKTTTTLELCTEDSSTYTLHSTVGEGYDTPAYQWQISTDEGETWTDIKDATDTVYLRLPTIPGIYWYRMATARKDNISSIYCRVVSNLIKILVDETPDPKVSSNNPACFGEDLQLASTNGANYSWTGPNGFTSNLQNPSSQNIDSTFNGYYKVSIITALGCYGSDSVYVEVNRKPHADAGKDTVICEGTSILLNGSGGRSFLWTPTSSLSDSTSPSPYAFPVDSTLYLLTVSNGRCRDYDSVNIYVWKKPVANAGPDKKIFDGDITTLDASIAGTNIFYYWDPDYNIATIDSLIPVVNPTTDTTYTLHVVSNYGCESAEDAVFVRVYKKITIPNAFSPNGDGINDVWLVDQLNTYPESETTVFDRWGVKVFDTHDYDIPWDGTKDGIPLPVGTYYYKISLNIGTGDLIGWVVILR